MNNAVIHIAVLITCFNRKQKTLQCLNSLQPQLQFLLQQQAVAPQDSQPTPVQLSVFLLDNGDDGTYEVVATAMPWVKLSRGHADLYWNSAMRRLWQQALAAAASAGESHQDPSFDFFLWLNDDVCLDPDAIPRLLQNYLLQTPKAGALVGTMAQPGAVNQPKVPSYGGRNRISALNPLAFGPVLMPTLQPQPCTFINGNLCLIPKTAVSAVGILSEHFSHGLGDFDYGLRLIAGGFALYVAPGFYGVCALNAKAGSVLDAGVPLQQRLAMLQRPNVLPPTTEWRYFVRCHGGPFWALLWLKSWVRQWCPALWLWLRQKRVA